MMWFLYDTSFPIYLFSKCDPPQRQGKCYVFDLHSNWSHIYVSPSISRSISLACFFFFITLPINYPCFFLLISKCDPSATFAFFSLIYTLSLRHQFPSIYQWVIIRSVWHPSIYILFSISMSLKTVRKTMYSCLSRYSLSVTSDTKFLGVSYFFSPLIGLFDRRLTFFCHNS